MRNFSSNKTKPKILLIGQNKFSPALIRRLSEFSQVNGVNADSDFSSLLVSAHILWARLGLKIDESLLQQAKSLVAVATNTTGLDHIDTEYCKNRDIAVISLKGETVFLNSIRSTAEHTWLLLLALLRRLPLAYQHVISGGWNRDLFIGADAAGKTFGIIGYGRLGGMVAEYAQTFQMRVCIFDPFIPADEIPNHITVMRELDELLSVSDVVSLHVHMSPETRHMISHKQFAIIKKGALLINTSRGGLIDEDALLHALNMGILGGAALDVLEGENEPDFPAESRIAEFARSHDNVIITPHIGGATCDSMQRTELFIADRIQDFLSSQSISKE